ncbi:hypothetical protein [Salinilacihabitans rarus]|nr:hypothetical protein [Salinilacihabitans rarus]
MRCDCPDAPETRRSYRLLLLVELFLRIATLAVSLAEAAGAL